jgi:adenine-specific DNA-methyltransferase
MAHIDALIDKVTDPALRQALAEQVEILLGKRSFGLVFQEHRPETVELPNYRIRRGCKVRIWGEDDGVLHQVDRLSKTSATISSLTEIPVQREIARTQLVVVREFGDPIYPGLEITDRVDLGGTKPAHMVINAENFHALETLLYTHGGKVDAVYIDPPYNTRDKDWKYNNDYVDSSDVYRHSKWLAMMQRRLQLTAKLMNPQGSVLIVTIDEKEYLRLGLLLEQTFPEANIQMITSVISPSGAARNREFTRVNEFIFFVMLGDVAPIKTPDDMLFTETRTETQNRSPIWNSLRRLGAGPRRVDSPSKFYPVFVDESTGSIAGVDDPLASGVEKIDYKAPEGIVAVFPTMTDGADGRWELNLASFKKRLEAGQLRAVRGREGDWNIQYLRNAQLERIDNGELVVLGRAPEGHLLLDYSTEKRRALYAKTVWNKPSHDSRTYGSWVLRSLIPGRSFPFPKSLYAVEDALRFFIGSKKEAVVLDFFAGSGTTLHAVARLNHQDGGSRSSICVTNNEVSDQEAKTLRKKGLNPGDPEWEALGICEYITKPRVRAAITGKTPSGDPVSGNYKFVDAFPMAEGFTENVIFFNLTYENPDLVSLGRKFAAVAPLLWLKAGGTGSMLSEIAGPWWMGDGARYGSYSTWTTGGPL